MRRALVVALAALAVSCSGARSGPADVGAARDRAAGSRDGEVTGRWLLAELMAPGGDAVRARAARKQLDALPHDGLLASLARAVDDEVHGHPDLAADAHLATLRAARSREGDALAPLYAWYASSRLLALRSSTRGLWARARETVESTLAHPGSVGWRARGDLVDWWGAEARGAAQKDALEQVAVQHGCAREVRLAGPFGHGAAADRRRHFDAERPGPWPLRFTPDASRQKAPHVLAVERHGCHVQAAEPVEPGIFYVETYVDLPAEREVLVAVQGAFEIRVDDAVVLERDTREWAVWPRFGARLRLSAGRHRVLARVGDDDTAIRLLAADGSPLGLPTSADPRPGYVARPPTPGDDPNPLGRFIGKGGVIDPGDVAVRFVAAHLAHIESQDDLASVLVEPLVKELPTAAGPALAAAASYVDKDPIFAPSAAHDLSKELRRAAAQKDTSLWLPRFWLALDEAEQKGLPDSIAEVKRLADEFRDVPDVAEGLATLYGRLGWKAERAVVLRELAARFPDDRALLEQVVSLEEEDGQHAKADALVVHIQQLDADSEIDLDRALARRDWPGALRELERLRERRPDRADIAERVATVMARAGNDQGAWERLERAVAKSPDDGAARLALADARYARGEHGALRQALADAILHGSDTSELAGAVELVEGATELEPFRLDGRAIVAAFEAAKRAMPGTAARVLDYSAIWIHPDGGSRTLEHELVRVQSQEAIQHLAEQPMAQGLLLRMRVLKKDGTVLEPEVVAGKPTLTLPHLEVGDYVETEHITSQRGDAQGGRRYVGPHWFFREADVAYFRSELLVVSPKDRPLVIETHGDVPEPVVRDEGSVIVRRWRKDESPAAPVEPQSAPVQEFLPSVRFGWGVSLADNLARLADAASDELPRDPRLAKLARAWADEPSAGEPAGPVDDEKRARRLYHRVLSFVEDGRESDARRVLTGRSGNRTSAFVYLCRLLGIPVELGVVRDRLSAPPRGALSEAESVDDFAVRLGLPKPVWLTVGEKFAPFRWLPVELRGQPAFRLVAGTPPDTTGDAGGRDGIVYDGKGELHPDGSATFEVVEKFVGKFGISLRAGLDQLGEAQRHDAVESKLVARAMPGARLERLDVDHMADLDEPLALRMRIEVSAFAERRGEQLVVSPPFAIRVGQLTPLVTRQTPLLIGEPTYADVHLALKLPPGATVVTDLSPVTVVDGDRKVSVRDRTAPGELHLERTIDLAAGRITPEAYGAFRAFAEKADEATLRDVVITLAKP